MWNVDIGMWNVYKSKYLQIKQMTKRHKLLSARRMSAKIVTNGILTHARKVPFDEHKFFLKTFLVSI